MDGIGGFFAWSRLSTEEGKRWRDKVKLRIPVANAVFQSLAVARSETRSAACSRAVEKRVTSPGGAMPSGFGGVPVKPGPEFHELPSAGRVLGAPRDQKEVAINPARSRSSAHGGRHCADAKPVQ